MSLEVADWPRVQQRIPTTATIQQLLVVVTTTGHQHAQQQQQQQQQQTTGSKDALTNFLGVFPGPRHVVVCSVPLPPPSRFSNLGEGIFRDVFDLNNEQRVRPYLDPNRSQNTSTACQPKDPFSQIVKGPRVVSTFFLFRSSIKIMKLPRYFCLKLIHTFGNKYTYDETLSFLVGFVYLSTTDAVSTAVCFFHNIIHNDDFKLS